MTKPNMKWNNSTKTAHTKRKKINNLVYQNRKKQWKVNQNVLPLDINELCNLVRKRIGIQRSLSVPKIQLLLNH